MFYYLVYKGCCCCPIEIHRNKRFPQKPKAEKISLVSSAAFGGWLIVRECIQELFVPCKDPQYMMLVNLLDEISCFNFYFYTTCFRGGSFDSWLHSMLRASMLFITFKRRNYDKATLCQLSDVLFHVSGQPWTWRPNTAVSFQPYYFPALDATMDQRSLPIGYSFLGHEPDPLVCCDLPECTVRSEEIAYKRLNCGHSFHITCLQPRDPANGPFVPNRATCPICHPLLEERIRELSTTMNRWVQGLEKN